ncbi:MAG: FAD-dependent oxidoreductase, partial [Anaerolineaceae bacterium]|nr:FAD-dependent oxidoreductase [Anaerolineaceae bacterium]
LKARVKLESLENVLLEPQTYETELGQTFTADMAFLCVGARPNTEFLRKGFADHLDQRGYLRVNEFLQMEGNPRIFAAGDMIASEESKMIYLGQRQAKHAAENVLRMIRGEVLLTHQPLSKEMILVSMGEEKGASQLPIGNGLVFGSWVTGILKGKDLFIQRYQKMLGQKS